MLTIQSTNFSLLRRSVATNFAERRTKTFLSTRSSNLAKVTSSNVRSRGAGKSFKKTWYRRLSMLKHIWNLKLSSKITKLQWLKTKSFVLIHHVNKSYKQIRKPKKCNAKHASVKCVFNVQLNGTKVNHVIKLKKNYTKAGPMSSGPIVAPSARSQSKRTEDACTWHVVNASSTGAGSADKKLKDIDTLNPLFCSTFNAIWSCLLQKLSASSHFIFSFSSLC